MKKSIFAISLAALSFCASLSAADLTLWYQQPAADNKPMDEPLPIGNGRMGALIFGSPTRERLCLNEDSLWTGGENPSGDYDSMGAYQVLGNVFVNLTGMTNIVDYRRDLDIANALAHVSYAAGGVKFRREYFCSHPAEILAAQFTADKKAAYTGSIELVDSHNAKIVADGHRLTATGTLDNGMKFEWQLLVLNQGGEVKLIPGIAGQLDGAQIEFKDCDGLTLLVAAGTDYVFDYAKHYHGEDPHARVTKQIDSAAKKTFTALRSEHVADFQALFNRVSADFGRSTVGQTSLPTDQRKLEAFKTIDPGLEALLFQYGRYLLISCSRPGGLPANLQGLWNDNNSPPWHSDYHANINIQMNYWPAEVANLAECHTPFFDLIQSQLARVAQDDGKPRRSSRPPMETLPNAASPSARRTTSPAASAGSGTRPRTPGIASICGSITRSAATKIIFALSRIRL